MDEKHKDILTNYYNFQLRTYKDSLNYCEAKRPKLIEREDKKINKSYITYYKKLIFEFESRLEILNTYNIPPDNIELYYLIRIQSVWDDYQNNRITVDDYYSHTIELYKILSERIITSYKYPINYLEVFEGIFTLFMVLYLLAALITGCLIPPPPDNQDFFVNLFTIGLYGLFK